MATNFRRKYYCNTCGKELTEETARIKFDVNEPSANCRECESKYFKKLEQKNGAHLALFACCMAFNVPFTPSLIPAKEELVKSSDKWEAYIDILNNRKESEKARKTNFFSDVTNILLVFGKNLTESDVAKYVAWEKAQLSSKPGTEEQRLFWGESNYTDEDYDDLDRMYNNFLSSFSSSITLTTQAQDTLVRVCKLRRFGDHALRNGDIKSANDAYKAADALLSSDCLREKDKKPVEEVRPDSFVKYLEDAGLMKDGDLLPYDELMEAFVDKFAKNSKFGYSLDAVDQMILIMKNTQRQNDGQELITGLTSDEAVIDFYGEFAPEETEAEKEAKHFAGLTKVDVKEDKR